MPVKLVLLFVIGVCFIIYHISKAIINLMFPKLYKRKNSKVNWLAIALTAVICGVLLIIGSWDFS